MLRLISLLLALHMAFAQFSVTFDKDSYDAGDTMKISWTEASNNVLNLQNQDKGQVLLCTCNSTAEFHCTDVKHEVSISDKSVSIPVSSILTIGPSGPYMIQFASHNSQKPSQYALAYSKNWAKINGLTGDGKAASQGCTIPQDADKGVPGTASSSAISWTSYTIPKSLQGVSGYDVPYTWQKGATRTAPFQSTPGTKVTKTTTPSRRFPSSSFSAFTTYVKNKYKPVTTLTPGPSSQAIQHTNFVPALATTPSGRKPSRVIPKLSIAKSSHTSGSHGRRRRWAD